MFRRAVSFAYLVQAEGQFDDRFIKSDDSVVVQLQWRAPSSCNGRPKASCTFFPNSTVNAGRNHLLQHLITRFPDVHPNFIIFMDEDARLVMRGDTASAAAAAAVDTPPATTAAAAAGFFSKGVTWYESVGNTCLITAFKHSSSSYACLYKSSDIAKSFEDSIEPPVRIEHASLRLDENDPILSSCNSFPYSSSMA